MRGVMVVTGWMVVTGVTGIMGLLQVVSSDDVPVLVGTISSVVY